MSINDASIEQLFARMARSGRLNLLLIANPTEDLPGTQQEADRVEQLLNPMQASIRLRKLSGKQATLKAVREEIVQADILHYCGHAFFDAPGEESSGLMLANGENLTLAEMRTLLRLPALRSSTLVKLAVFVASRQELSPVQRSQSSFCAAASKPTWEHIGK